MALNRECDMESFEKPLNQLVLPPCRVCGSKASGFHFGVISCEACKVFFRRSQSSKKTYNCKKDERCDIQQSTGAPCSFCRWEKCLRLGMSRNEVKKGRCSLKRRAKTLKEVRETKEQAEREREAEMRKENERVQRIESRIQSALEADHLNQFVTPEFQATVSAKQRKHMEVKEANESIFGTMKPVSHEVFQDVYKNCGLEIDDRKKKIEFCVAKTIDDTAAYIGFAKALPGFNELVVTDRIILLRESCYEWYLFTGVPIVNPDQMMYTCPSCGITFDSDDLQVYQDKTFPSFFSCMKLLKPLDLSVEELALAKAVAVFNPYGCTVSQPEEHEKIEKIQQKYLEALQYLLEKNRPSRGAAAKVLGKIISSITVMKDLYHTYSKQGDDSWLGLFPDVSCPDIVRELFDTRCNSNTNLIKVLES